MNKAILKRIEILENVAKQRDIPSLIMIHYDWRKNQFCVKETYCNSKGYGVKDKAYYYDHYKDYEIPAAYDGTVIMDLIDVPKEFAGNIHSINTAEVRRELNVSDCGLKAEYMERADSKHSNFSVTVVKRR